MIGDAQESVLSGVGGADEYVSSRCMTIGDTQELVI